MASDDPMASPSGRACEVTTNRWRRRISSATAATVDSLLVWLIGVGWGSNTRCFAIVRAPGFFLVQVPENLLDAILVGDRFVEPEFQFRYASKLQDTADLAPQEGCGA